MNWDKPPNLETLFDAGLPAFQGRRVCQRATVLGHTATPKCVNDFWENASDHHPLYLAFYWDATPMKHDYWHKFSYHRTPVKGRDAAYVWRILFMEDECPW